MLNIYNYKKKKKMFYKPVTISNRKIIAIRSIVYGFHITVIQVEVLKCPIIVYVLLPFKSNPVVKIRSFINDDVIAKNVLH